MVNQKCVWYRYLITKYRKKTLQVKVESKEGEDEKVAVQYVTAEQKLLLEQQIRQHVQMLTQNFLLTYNHPEFHEMAIKYKEFLVNSVD